MAAAVEEAAESTIGCIVLQADHGLDWLSDPPKSCKVSPGFAYVGCLHESSILEILLLCGRKGSSIKHHCHVADFCWDEKTISHHSPKLTIHENNGSLLFLEVVLKDLHLVELRTTQTIPFQAMQNLLKNHAIVISCATQLRLLQYLGDRVYILLDEKDCICLCGNNVEKMVSLSSFVDEFIDLRMVEDNLYLLTREHVLIISMSSTGCFLTHRISLQRLGPFQSSSEEILASNIVVDKNQKHVAIGYQPGYVSVARLIFDQEDLNGYSMLQKDIFPLENSSAGSRSFRGSTSTLDSCWSLNESIKTADNISLNYPVNSAENYSLPIDYSSWHNRLTKSETVCSKLENRQTLNGKRSNFSSQKLNQDGMPTNNFHVMPPSNSINMSGLFLCRGAVYVVYETRNDSATSSENSLTIKIVSCIDENSSCIMQINKNCKIIEGDYFNHPILILDEKNILVLVEGLLQETLINKCITYTDATTADCLSTMNDWQTIHLPLNILILGLKNHLLDTVIFFLKSRIAAFLILTESTELVEEARMNAQTQISELKSVIETILSSIQDSFNEKTSLMFAKQLVKVTMNCLNSLLQKFYKDGNTSLHTTWSLYNNFMNEMMHYIIRLRKLCSSDVSIVTHKGSFSLRQDESMQNRIEIHDSIKVDCTTTAMRDAIRRREIPASQKCLIEKQIITEIDEDLLGIYMKIGQNYIKELLDKEDFHSACLIMRNLGLNYRQVLRSCFDETWDRHLQKFVLSHLMLQSLLKVDDHEHLQKLQQIQDLYPCTSYFRVAEHIKDDKNQKSTWKNDCELQTLFFNMSSSIVRQSLLISGETNDKCDRDNWENFSYCNMTFNWMKKVPEDTFRLMLIDGILASKGGDSGNPSVHDGALWQHYLKNNDNIQLTEWISKALKKELETDITMEAVNAVVRFCHPYVVEKLMTELARSGMITENEQQHITNIMYRMNQIQTGFDGLLPFFASKHSIINIETFHKQFLQFCIKHDLVNVAFEYIKHFHSILINDIKNEFLTTTWFPLLLMMYQLGKTSALPKDIVSVSMCNLQYINKTKSASFRSFFEGNQSLAGFASLLYQQETFTADTWKKFTEDENLAPEFLFRSLKSFPILMASLSPFILRNGCSDHDVSIYELLQNNATFNVDQIYGSRHKNVENLEEFWHEIPNFSQPELMKTYGHQIELDFLYYLNLGRPCYAYTKFLAQEILQKKQLQWQRINVACALAAGLALENFNQPHLTATCTAFIEMLGQNSSWLRLHLAVAGIVAQFYNCSEFSPNVEKDADPITISFQDLLPAIYQNDPKRWQALKVVTNLLESAAGIKADQDETSKFSLMTLLDWKPLMNFCTFHQFDLSTGFLRKCARSSDWLMFILFAQFYGFPKTQIFNLLDDFVDPILKDHLKNAFRHLSYRKANVVAREKENCHAWKMRDARHCLYRKIGLARKNPGDGERIFQTDLHSPPTSEDLSDTLSAHTESHFKIDDVTDDCFEILIRSHDTCSPSRSLLMSAVALCNPTLAVLSACYPAASETSSLEQTCIWLISSADKDILPRILPIVRNAVDTQTWIRDDLIAILKIEIEKHRFTHLSQAFRLFQKSSPILPLLTFLEMYFESEKESRYCDQLRVFAITLSDVHNQEADPGAIISDVEWIEKTCIEIILHSLSCCTITSQICVLLELLVQSDLSLAFKTTTVPNFDLLLKMQQCLLNTSIRLDYEMFLADVHEPKFQEKCHQILANLIHQQHFNEAGCFAALTCLDKDIFVMARLNEECQSQMQCHKWQQAKTRLDFWLDCFQIFKNENVDSRIRTAFFAEHASRSQNHSEKFFLLKLGLVSGLAHENDTMCQSKQVDLEIEMWQCRIHAEMQLEFIQPEGKVFLKGAADILPRVASRLRLKQHIWKKIQVEAEPFHLMASEEVAVLDRLIGVELKAGSLESAWHLAHLFHQQQQLDLQIILTCMDLAEGNLQPQNIDPQILNLLSDKMAKERTNSSSSDVTLSLGPQQQTQMASLETDGIIACLKRLGNCSEHGKQHCSLILLYYEIAAALGLDYQVVIQEPNLFVLLKELLKTNCPNKYNMAKHLIASNKIPEKDVVIFLTEQLISALNVLVNLILDPIRGRSCTYVDVKSVKAEVDSTFSQLVSLCNKPASLGYRLLKTLKFQISSEKEVENEVFWALQIELLVRANECFNLACNTEGIAHVLQLAKILAEKFCTTNKFTLVVRLLTGIGRYSEMQYVFNILLEQGQFEMLLKKGMNEIVNLKQALLDFVNYSQLLNTELFTMIAVRFQLHREMAIVFEMAATRKLKEVNFLHRENLKYDSKTLIDLQEYFADAARHYLKADCHCHASSCAQKAQLMALQVHWLPMGPKVLDLSEKEAAEFVINHSNFLEVIFMLN